MEGLDRTRVGGQEPRWTRGCRTWNYSSCNCGPPPPTLLIVRCPREGVGVSMDTGTQFRLETCSPFASDSSVCLGTESGWCTSPPPGRRGPRPGVGRVRRPTRKRTLFYTEVRRTRTTRDGRVPSPRQTRVTGSKPTPSSYGRPSVGQDPLDPTSLRVLSWSDRDSDCVCPL